MEARNQVVRIIADREMDRVPDFRKALADCGIQKGDILNVASDVSEILLMAKRAGLISSKYDMHVYMDEMVDALKDAVGKEGTLLFPVYNMGFCAGKGFDFRNTPGDTGALANHVLFNRADFRRTKNPTHSFAVWGRDAEFLTHLDNQESTGLDSPYKYMHDNDGKWLMINIPLRRGFTFMHYVEQCVDVPFRYHKYFLGKYVNADGVETVRCYSVFVMDLSIERDTVLSDEFFEKSEAMVSSNAGFYKIKLADLKKAYELISDDLLNNGGLNCYQFGNYKLDWSVGKTHDIEMANRLEPIESGDGAVF